LESASNFGNRDFLVYGGKLTDPEEEWVLLKESIIDIAFP
jgi:hypothetical protein